MGIGYWNPLAGVVAAHAMRAEMDAAARKADRIAAERERYLTVPYRTATEHTYRRPKKCPGCGSHSFAMTRAGRICSYCRTPEGDFA